MSELTILCSILAFIAAIETVRVMFSVMALLRPTAGEVISGTEKVRPQSKPLFAIPCWGLEKNKVRFLPPSGREDVLDLNGQSGTLILNGQDMMAVFFRRGDWREQ